MDTKIIDGKKVAESLRAKVAERVAALKVQKGVTPGLTVVLVGNDPASEVYVRNKVKFSHEAGINSDERRLPPTISEAELIAEVEALNADPKVHGILVQLPLPKHISEHAVINSISPQKDVDGFHLSNVGMLATGQNSFVPCTPLGCLMLLKETLGNLAGKHAVIVGRSNIVGKPMASLLLREDCTVTIAHSKTVNLPEMVKQADIVVAAVGKANLIRGSWIKPGATVIDVGINRIEVDGKTKLTGDVAFDECIGVAGAITPVPGGVGPMTIACLLSNTCDAAERKL